MANIQTVKNKEGFLVQMNGDYNVPFDEIEVTGTFKAGDVLEDASTKVSDTTSAGDVLGILAEDVEGSGWARVMVRGNPSTVNAQELDVDTATAADIYADLEDAGIVVVNK